MYNSIWEEIREINLQELSMELLLTEYPMLPVKFPNLVTLVDKTVGEMIDENIHNKKLKGLITNTWWFFGLPPDKCASILFSIPTYNYIEFNGGLLPGKSQGLSHALADGIKEAGGNVLLNTEAIKINIDVRSVETNNNGTYFAEYIISNVNPFDTVLNMIDKDKISEGFRKRIKNSEVSISALQLYCGLDCDPKKLGMENNSIGVYETYDHTECYDHILQGNYDKSNYLMTNFTHFDEEIKSKGMGVLNILTLDHIKNWENLNKEEYRIKKKKVTDYFIQKASRIIPGLAAHIVICECGTPVTIKRYTKHPEGAIYGFSNITSQSGINRFTNKTPIKGLYFTGAYTYPGLGFSSVIESGYRAAKLILNEEEAEKCLTKSLRM